jgi:hypothetical protein
MITALIDGDVLVYKCGFASQRSGYVYVDNESYLIADKKADLENSLRSLGKPVSEIQKETFENTVDMAYFTVNSVIKAIVSKIEEFFHDQVEIKIYLTSTDKSNFRYSIAKTQPYKSNRVSEKPFYYDVLRNYLQTIYGAEVVYDQEADDAIATEMDANSVICSIDKDLKQVTGFFLNFDSWELRHNHSRGDLYLSKDKKKLQGSGLLWFYAQVIMGDTVDTVPGLSGYGDVRTYNFLKSRYFLSERELARHVLALYFRTLRRKFSRNVVYDRFFEMVDLVWLRRKPNQCKSDELKELMFGSK